MLCGISPMHLTRKLIIHFRENLLSAQETEFVNNWSKYNTQQSELTTFAFVLAYLFQEICLDFSFQYIL